MPTIYKYLGIFFYFWSNDHDPIHVHAKYQGMECKVLLYPDGRIEVDNYLLSKNMDPQTLRKIERFAIKYKDKIKKKWSDYHLYGKKLKPEIITRAV